MGRYFESTEEATLRILSLDGGGYLGLASASFLNATERHFQIRCHDQFDLFCGTSTGAIIALALASGMSADEVVRLYEDLGRAVFPPGGMFRRAGRWMKGLVLSRYSNEPLRSALDDAFGDRTLADLEANGKYALITAFNLSKGEPRIFKTDHASRLSTDSDYRLADVALASAAAPTYFPVVTIPAPTSGIAQKFCDGGLFANHPALLGLSEAIADLCVAAEEVDILSISTPRSDLSEHESSTPWWKERIARRGMLLWAPDIMNVAMDSTSKIAHHVLDRTAGALGATYERVLLPKPEGLKIDTATAAATRTLKNVGVHAADDGATRTKLRYFFPRGE